MAPFSRSRMLSARYRLIAQAWPFALLLALFLITHATGCEHKKQSKPVYFPGGYKRIPPEKIPANIDARLLRPWEEDAQFDANGLPVTPVYPVTRFWFYPNGYFAVNWHVFEIDFWEYGGEYSADKGTGEMVLKMTGGNDMPADFAGRGKYSFDDKGRLILTGIWLGTPRTHPAASQPAAHSGHRFRDSGDYAQPADK